MNYAQIRSMDISNGEGIGVSLFVQGCDIIPHCKGCFNYEAWDFNGGKEWTEEIENKFLDLLNKPYVTRCSILGGEPLADGNIATIESLLYKIHKGFPEKKIWIYTGRILDQILNPSDYCYESKLRKILLQYTDVLVDGEYIEEQKDITLKWRGSKNQRVINIPETLKQNKIVLYCD